MKLANFVDEFPRFFFGDPGTFGTVITRPFTAMRQSIRLSCIQGPFTEVIL